MSLLDDVQDFNFPYLLDGARCGGPSNPHQRPWMFQSDLITVPQQLYRLPEGYVETLNYLVKLLQALYDLCSTQGGEHPYVHALKFAESTFNNVWQTYLNYEQQSLELYPPQTVKFMVTLKPKLKAVIRNFYYDVLGCPQEELYRYQPRMFDSL